MAATTVKVYVSAFFAAENAHSSAQKSLEVFSACAIQNIRR
jgi:hypothetical protein